MTSRERVMASVSHKEPDYLPMDLGSNVSTGITLSLDVINPFSFS